MHGKTVLITGGNSGVGLATAGALGRLGAHVVITARDMSKGRAAIAALRESYGVEADLVQLDLASFTSIRACASEVLERYPRLDVLINNAGLHLSRRQETVEGFEYTFGVNYVGHVLLTSLLLERIQQSAPARIVNLSSAAHMGARKGIDWDDLGRLKKYDGQAYCQAKLAIIYYTQELADRLQGTGVSVFAVNPGFVATRFGQDGDTTGLAGLFFRLGKYWMADPDKGARTSAYAATQPGLAAYSGAYLDDAQVKKPSRVALDVGARKKLWGLTEQMLAKASTPGRGPSRDVFSPGI